MLLPLLLGKQERNCPCDFGRQMLCDAFPTQRHSRPDARDACVPELLGLGLLVSSSLSSSRMERWQPDTKSMGEYAQREQTMRKIIAGAR